MGLMVLAPGKSPKFVQLYIFAFFTMVDWASLILHG
jgi:hypothetical protein